MNHNPYSPIRDKQWLENFLNRNFYRQTYNPYFWWRNYKRKTKPLSRYASNLDKIENGDYDEASYRYEIDLLEHKLKDGWDACYPDIAKFMETYSIDLTRVKRLKEDLEKDEKEKLELLYRDLRDEFGISYKEIEEYIMNSKYSKLSTIYQHMKKKYKNKFK